MNPIEPKPQTSKPNRRKLTLTLTATATVLSVTAILAGCNVSATEPDTQPTPSAAETPATPVPTATATQEPAKAEPAAAPVLPQGEYQVVELTRVASTTTTVSTNVSAKKNPDGSVDLTISTADGSLLNGVVGAKLSVYLCADGYQFNENVAPFKEAAGVFVPFENQNSATVNLSNIAFNDHHANCNVQKFQITGNDMHANLRISGSPSFTV